MKNFAGKRRPSISLSLFATLSESFSSEKSPNSTKSPRNFEGGVVGLGIVAAMTDLGNTQDPCVLFSQRSSPIPIVLAAKPAANFLPNLNKHELDEFSESYTCVISHFGHNLIKKRVYFDDKIDGVGGYSTSCVVDCGVFSTSPVSFGEGGREFWSEDFLSSCYLCKKKLHGLDIFMYRGEKAFCSIDCRNKQIRSDDHKDKCGSEAIKPLEYSASPCSGPMPCFAGVSAA